ncbi:MAG: tRNA pseudouridine(38-40) synthase TruA [Alphaproteobacteria bacterium]|nr:tRNA pseudouridine(38-40) synthase TruA [Alphaproteobacteria bacterium]
MVRRFKLTIEYDGTLYHGWQMQEGLATIQGALQEAIFVLTGERADIYVSGRTDAGVHALAQVAHVDIRKELRPFQVMSALNSLLKPQPISILHAEDVAFDFHARFSTLYRQYRYRIINRRAPLAIEHNRAWRVVKPLDVALMQRAANHLIGHHDFSSFRSTECQAASPMKHLDVLQCLQQGDAIEIMAKAPSFLHNQVRITVGTLAEVGMGNRLPDEIKTILDAKDRRAAGQTAPACGLYLEHIGYPV